MLWLGLVVLLSIAVCIFVWPLWQGKQNILADFQGNRSAANVSLYQEHARDLETSFSAGDLDERAYQNLLLELKRKLLADNASQVGQEQGRFILFGRNVLIVSLVFCIVSSLLFYLMRGSSADLHILNAQEAYAKLDMQDVQNNRKPNTARTYALINLIKQRLLAVPNKAEYWYLLSVYAMRVSDYTIAIEGYRGVRRISPNDANNTAALAQAIFLDNGSQMSPEVVTVASSALVVNPAESTALGLMGIDAFERQDYPAVIRYWSQAAEQLTSDAPGKVALLAGIARAKQALGGAGGNVPEEVSVNTGIKLPITVSLQPDLSPIAGTLFVYVRKWQASPMPLLVTKITNFSFPLSVTLDETMAMIDASGIRNAGQLELVARISASGSAIPATGDLEGHFGPFDSQQLPESMSVVINTRR